MLGYENNFFLCSSIATEEILFNTCNAMVISNFWLTFLNIQNLSSKLMSCLSTILGQINDRQETVTINNTPVNLTNYDDSKPKQIFAYFATTHTCNEHLRDAKVDSLKITRLDHYLNKISKQLLECFRVVHFDFDQFKCVIKSNLIAHGFQSIDEFTNEIIKLVDLYKMVLKRPLYRNGK